MLYKINYMDNPESHILGLEEGAKKIKGIAEFTFEEKGEITMQPLLDNIVPKKKEHKITITNARRGKHTKSGKTNELF